jgi:hypothetical protein
MAHGVGKLLERVLADAVRGRWRDVGGNDGAQRRGQGQAASHRFAARHAMAGDAVAGRGQVAAALDGCAASGPAASTGKASESKAAPAAILKVAIMLSLPVVHRGCA